MSKKYKVFFSNKISDLEKVSNFLNKHFGDANDSEIWTKEELNWKLSNLNPAGEGYMAFAKLDDEIIGTAAIVKKRLLINGNSYLGAEIGETYTHPDFRKGIKPESLFENNSDPNHYLNKSIFGRLISELKIKTSSEKIEIIYGTPNENSKKGYLKRLGFFEMQNYKNISMSKFIYRNLFFKKNSERLIFSTDKKKSKNKKIYLEKKFKISRDFPSLQDIDLLWSEVRPAKGFSLVRDGKYWNFRYKSHPVNDYIYYSIYLKGKLAALIVIRFKKVKNLKTLFLVEWMTTKDIKFSEVLKLIIEDNKDLKIQKMNLWSKKNSSNFFSALKKGFIPAHNIPIIFNKTDISSKFDDPGISFDFFLGTSDTI